MHDIDIYLMKDRQEQLRATTEHLVRVREARRAERAAEPAARPMRAFAGLLGLRGDARRTLKGRRSLA